ncbi:ATP-binding protein [Caldimonas sp. KR1-144]|uniref:ATP-binding protein n=1 Tax=Caldimonas sp. KR1-144 TaxID=3400911 RepID=UPI003C2C449F
MNRPMHDSGWPRDARRRSTYVPGSSLVWRLPAAFAALVICLLVLLASTWNAYDELREAQRWRTRSEQVLAAIAELREQTQPGAALALCASTGGPPLALPRPVAQRANSAAQLAQLVADNPAQAQRAKRLAGLIDDWQQAYDTPLREACTRGLKLGAAQVLSQARIGQPMRDQIVATLDSMQATEMTLATERETRLEAATESSRRMLFLLAAATVLLGVLATLAVRSFTRQLVDSNRRLRLEGEVRAVSQQRLRESQRRLRMVLDHLPDAVIAFGEQGQVQWLNPAGEAMFRRSRASVTGAPITELMPELEAELHWPTTQPDEPVQETPEDSRFLLEPWTAHRITVEGVRAAETGGRTASRFAADVALVRARIDGDRLGVCIVRDLSEVERVERMKRDFVSMVSHELRTPLTSIRGSLSMLTDGAAGELPAPAQRLVKLAHTNSERLVALVNDILDLEKLRAGEMRMTPVPLDLAEAVKQAIDACEAIATQQQVRVTLERQLVPVPVTADPLRLAQVLTNLLSNAIKFSPALTDVNVVVRAQAGLGRVVVTDSGPGVPPDFVPRLFEPFAQADDLNTRKKGGTGLGLVISKALIEQMGGQIGLDASGPGQGAVFWISLPLRDAGQ